jgi:hypothetical protein
MPPRLPARAPWRSQTLPNRWDHNICIRAFSSTPSALALGPQSPNYVEVPKPLQPTFPPKPSRKGHLPVPRDIFKTRNVDPKESDKFLDRSAPSPTELKVPGPYSRDADYRLYKQRLADKRREALREGVKQLHERKVTTEGQHLARIQANYADKLERATAPPREVDVLTQTSIPKGIRDFLSDDLPKSSRSFITRARREAYSRRMARVHNVRTSRLHDLYINAREFIVDEQQLDEAIEKTFGTEEAPLGWDNKGIMGLRSEGHEGLSPWHGYLPEGVGDMLQKLKGGEGVGLAKERVKKVAEALTGGKM